MSMHSTALPLKRDLQKWIPGAEEKWLISSRQFLEEIFSDTFLPSHDQTHHVRVWNIGKSLLMQIASFNRHLDASLAEGLLIAAMFHDAGMAVTREKEHGRISRELCEKWFRRQKLPPPERFGEVVDAIEKHDNKEDRICARITRDEAPDLLTLLSLADDLEALGVIGVYRYTEIYLARGIELQELGIHILKNARSRFGHISESCALCPQLLEGYRQEYASLVSFFDIYNQQLLVETDPEQVRTGYVGIVNAIRRLSVEGRIRPEDFLTAIGKEDPGKLVTDFFTRLKEELRKERLNHPDTT